MSLRKLPDWMAKADGAVDGTLEFVSAPTISDGREYSGNRVSRLGSSESGWVQ